MFSLRRFLTRWTNLIGLAMVAVIVTVALAAPQIAPPLDPNNPADFKVVGRATDRTPHPPSDIALLGTAGGQTDIFYSVVWGVRSALQFGVTTAFATAIFGVLLGAISGYLGGLFNSVVLRVTDAFLTIPVIAGVWLIQQLLFPPYSVWVDPPPVRVLMESLNLNPVMLAIVLFSWMPYARLINANVLRLKTADFILASQSLGVNKPRMIFKHILPNTMSPAVVLLARDIGGLVILEATFTFIGLGVGNVWGEMLVNNRNWIIGLAGNPFTYWWVYLPPTIALIWFGVSWNLLGDGLNDLLNPREQ